MLRIFHKQVLHLFPKSSAKELLHLFQTLPFHINSLLFEKMAGISKYTFTVSAILWNQVGVNHTFSGSLPSQILTFQARDNIGSTPRRGYFQRILYPTQKLNFPCLLLFRFLLFPALLHSFDSILPLFTLQFHFQILGLIVILIFIEIMRC